MRFFSNDTLEKQVCRPKSGINLYPFGMDMPGRKYSSNSYKYSFNGKLIDEEIFEGAQDFGLREYDNRLGRFFSTDPFRAITPNKTPYDFAGNSPIAFIDKNGGFQVPPELAAKYPMLNNIAAAISNAANIDPTMDNPVIREFICAAGLPDNQESVETALQILSYGSGPVINVRRMKDFGSYDNDAQSINIRSRLVKSLGKSDNYDVKAAQYLGAFLILWHEGIHYADFQSDCNTDYASYLSKKFRYDNGDEGVRDLYGMMIRAIRTINPNDPVISVAEDIRLQNKSLAPRSIGIMGNNTKGQPIKGTSKEIVNFFNSNQALPTDLLKRKGPGTNYVNPKWGNQGQGKKTNSKSNGTTSYQNARFLD